MLRAKRFDIPAGQRTKVLWIFSSSIPGDVRFSASAAEGNNLSGKVEVHRQRWFQWQQEDHDLTSEMVFEKGMSDGDYRIFVTPDQDTTIQFRTRHARAETFFVILACVLGLGIVSGLTAFLLAPPPT